MASTNTPNLLYPVSPKYFKLQYERGEETQYGPTGQIIRRTKNRKFSIEKGEPNTDYTGTCAGEGVKTSLAKRFVRRAYSSLLVAIPLIFATPDHVVNWIPYLVIVEEAKPPYLVLLILYVLFSKIALIEGLFKFCGTIIRYIL